MSELERPTENDVSTLSDMLDQLELDENDCEHRNPTQITCTVPSLKSKVRYQDPDTNVWRKALVISQAGKVSGKNKNWFNVKHLDDDTMKSVNFEAIPGWENLNEEVLLCKGGTFEVAEAKLKELQNWRINKVYDEVDDEKQSSISVRWVLTEKMIEGKTQVKARMVAPGFEDAGRDNVRKDSPTCGRENLRLLFALTSSCNWRINILDIKSAFLQGKSIERDVFIKPPKEANTNKLWTLKTTVYGLRDAPREWYLSVKKQLVATRYVKSGYDAVFYWQKENTLQGILSAHVDDFCWAGTKLFQNIVINHIQNAFTVSKKETKLHISWFEYITNKPWHFYASERIHRRD